MRGAAHLLALWLTPALWLSLPSFIVNEGPAGLWIGLGLTLIPLIALGVASRAAAERRAGGDQFSATVLLLVAGLLIWANLVLAGDLAAELGAPRWQGIAIGGIVAWLFSTPRAARRIVPGLLLIVAAALAVSSGELAREVGVDPLSAWERVATQQAFRFPDASGWVTTGRDLDLGHGRAPLTFDEEHRVTAPSGGVLRARSVDGGRVSDREWTLSPGQSVTFRAGDQLLPPVPSPLRFEAGKRIPGSPTSGIAWAEGADLRGPRALELHLTLLVGGVALLSTGLTTPLSRRAVGLLGSGLVATVLWAQGWAVYGLLSAPEVFLGGVTAERLAGLRAAGLERLRSLEALGGLVLAAALASFVASSIALRARVTALAAGGVADHQGLWAAVFGVAGLLSLWRPADAWWLAVMALGTAAAGLGPAALWPLRGSGAATAAGVVGLLVLAAAAALAGLRSIVPDLFRVSRPAWLAAGWEMIIEHPVPASVICGAAVLWIARLVTRR